MQAINKELLKSYSSPSVYRSLSEIVITLSLMVLAYVGLYSYLTQYPLAVFLLSFPAGLLLVRVFILQHDAGHGTLFSNTKYNNMVGLLCSLFTLTPYYFWRHAHAIHHRNSSNIDQRGIGDIDFKTITEYKSLGKWQKLKYFIMRHPIFLIGFSGIIYFLIQNRYFNYDKSFRTLFNKRSVRSIYITNIVCLMLYSLLFYYLNLKFFLIVLLPIFWASSSIGIYLFYVQHNFENVYFGPSEELTSETVSQGSSFLNLPGILRWMTGNIGYHHIHHLCPRIPFYHLKKLHKKLYHSAQTPKKLIEYSFIDSLQLLKLKLYDEKNKKMISWKEYAEKYCQPSQKLHIFKN